MTKDLPSGCLAGGTPARVIRENAYPARLDRSERERILGGICARAGVGGVCANDMVFVGSTIFHVAARAIHGPVTQKSERLRNQLRRHGIRFRYEAIDGEYRPWT